MGHDKAVIQNGATMGDEIQVQGARRIGLSPRATEPRLHLMQRVQNLARRQRGPHDRDAV